MQLLKETYQLSLHLNDDLCHSALKASRERCRSSNTRVMKRSAVCKCTTTAVIFLLCRNQLQRIEHKRLCWHCHWFTMTPESEPSFLPCVPTFLPHLLFSLNIYGEGLLLWMSVSPSDNSSQWPPSTPLAYRWIINQNATVWLQSRRESHNLLWFCIARSWFMTRTAGLMQMKQ